MAEEYDVPPIRVFISFAPEDTFLLEELERSLTGLPYKISVWDDGQVKSGEEPEKVVRAYLNEAHLILLLISNNFMDSLRCDNSMLWAMKRHKASNVPVIPIILRAGDYKEAPFRDLQPLPSINMPITSYKSWTTLDDAFKVVAKGIREVVEELPASETTQDGSQSNTSLQSDPKPTHFLSSTEFETAWPPPLLPASRRYRARRTRRMIFGCLSLLLVLMATIVLAGVFPFSAAVRITPKSAQQGGNYAFVAVTSTPDTTQHQVQARQLAYTTPPQSKTVKPTGMFQDSGVQSKGRLTFYNGKTISQTVAAGTVFTDAHGIQLAIDEDVTIPAANPPIESQVSVNAYAVRAGINGNIAALDINWQCCSSDYTIFVQNPAPFTGGKDALNYTFIRQNDIDDVANALELSLVPSAKSSFQSLVHANEQLLAPPKCTNKVSSDHNAGDKVDKLAVTVIVTCTSEVYDRSAVERAATALFKQDTLRNLGTKYALVDNTLAIIITKAKVIDTNKGTVSLQIRVEGSWVYQFDAIQKQKLIKLIVGKTKLDAIKVLKQQTGVVDVQIDAGIGNLPLIDAGIGNLPSDSAKISIQISQSLSSPSRSLRVA